MTHPTTIKIPVKTTRKRIVFKVSAIFMITLLYRQIYYRNQQLELFLNLLQLRRQQPYQIRILKQRYYLGNYEQVYSIFLQQHCICFLLSQYDFLFIQAALVVQESSDLTSVQDTIQLLQGVQTMLQKVHLETVGTQPQSLHR